MNIIDFEYDGERLSNYGLNICHFDTDGGFNSVDLGNAISVNKVKPSGSNKFMFIGSPYDDSITLKFEVGRICPRLENSIITDNEITKILRWLNRKTCCTLKFIYDDYSFSDTYYEGLFNYEVLLMGHDIIGLSLTFISNAPFAFIDPVTYYHSFSPETPLFVVNDISDETGHLYCDVEIECLEDCNINIDNENDHNTLIINNCLKGELITLKGESKIIQSDINHKLLCNDFNYNFLRICNSYEDDENRFYCENRCNVAITYSPIRKVGAILC